MVVTATSAAQADVSGQRRKALLYVVDNPCVSESWLASLMQVPTREMHSVLAGLVSSGHITTHDEPVQHVFIYGRLRVLRSGVSFMFRQLLRRLRC